MEQPQAMFRGPECVVAGIAGVLCGSGPGYRQAADFVACL
jgi:hypothetical protein